MSTSGFNSEGAPRPGRETESGNSSHRPSQISLEQVLEQTLARLGASEPLAEADVLALQGVADRRRGLTLQLDPVAVELVEALLGDHLRIWLKSPEAWRSMTTEIAQALLDHPASQARLQSLWSQLTGRA